MSTKSRATFDLIAEDQIDGNDQIINELPVIANGVIWRIQCFGGCDEPVDHTKGSLIALQLYDGGWTTLRAISVLCSTFEICTNRSILGDGNKKIRVVRQNKSSSSKRVVAWITGIKI